MIIWIEIRWLCLQMKDQLQDKSEQFQNLIETEYDTVLGNGDIAAAPEELYLMMDEFMRIWPNLRDALP